MGATEMTRRSMNTGILASAAVASGPIFGAEPQPASPGSAVILGRRSTEIHARADFSRLDSASRSQRRIVRCKA